MKKLEEFLEWGGVKKDITCLILSGIALIISLLKVEVFGIDLAWVAIILCGIPIILEAVVGLLTGDHEKAAHTIADKLNIREVYANCLPELRLFWQLPEY